MLSHYQMVIWYTGDDYITREPGQPAGTGTSNLALEEEVAARDFINEGGKLFFTGKNAGRQYADGFEFKNFGPQPDEVKTAAKWCDAGLPEAKDGCIAHTNDFLQYHLGAYTYVGGNGLQGTDPDELFDVEGIADPFTGLSFGFDPVGTGPGNGSNQNWGATFIITSSILDPVTYPTFASSEKLATWSRGGSAAPYDPISGAWYMAAGADDASYKRLGRQIDLTGKSGGNLRFQISYDLELDYDYTFVEVLDKTTGKWTTVPVPGRTSTDVGLSCPTTGDGSAWHTNHPFLASYQTVTGGGDTCDPTGTDGSWNAANGNSGGWQEWNVDLTPFAGKDIELYISVASDAAVLGLGVFVDDIELAVAGDPVVTGGFEADGDDAGFAVAPPPPGTDSTITGWHRSQGEFEEGPVAGTSDSVYTGFGFEGINDAGKRGQVMGAVLQHLGIAP